MKICVWSIVLFTALLSVNAEASIIWRLNNFVFTDGGTATGSFTWNDVSTAATAWDISTSGPGTSVHYANTTGSTVDFPTQGVLIFAEGSLQFRVGLMSLDNLNTSVSNLGLYALDVGLTGPDGFLQCDNCTDVRYGTSGAYLSAQGVPAPATLALFAFALGVLGVATWRVRKA